ncbi:hypothetical protein BSL78_17294 [Apostichopus japonicus]|uniref:Death ligand signal enhancer n=1 Tax=Stichopus japonicus TaxID=307972 RepID=A0A2G8KCW0_STIJA|nr:hypothetical protein BSL78_17294 [Apostichopus japonicus]
MLRTIQNLPKVLRAHTPCSSNRNNPSQTPAPVLIERASDHSSEPDRKLCVKPPGHVAIFSSWLPIGPSRGFFDLFSQDRNHEDLTQQQRWQSHRRQHTEFEGFGWLGEEALSRKDGGVLDEKQSKFGDEETAGDELKDFQQQSLSTDEILPALEGALVHLRKTSQKTKGMIQTMMGIQFASLGRYKKAVSHFESASQLGYSKAQYNLGQCYELGQGVELDLAKAVNLYERAAEQDHPLALYKLGMYHYHGLGATPEDESVGFKFMQRAAEAGVILAHSFLGNYYLQTKTRDVEKAILHLRAAVEEQETESEYLLGLCYEQGWGVHRNTEAAAGLYHRAAKAGYPLAMYSLGTYFEKGLGGVLQDKDQAKKLYTDASKRGLDLASERLRRLSRPEEKANELSEGKEARRVMPTAENRSINKLKVAKSEDGTIHSSNSESCLSTRGENVRNGIENSLTLSYLSLILPSVLRTSTVGTANEELENKHVDFQIGDGEENGSSWRLDAVDSVQIVV